MTEIMEDMEHMLGAVDHEALIRAAMCISSSDVLIMFGNGGSMANASHLVGDLLLRTPTAKTIKCIGDNAVMFSACANDYSFEEAVSIELERSLNAEGNKTFIVFSTSGESKNILRAAKTAKKNGARVIAFLGEHLHRIEPFADIVLAVPGKKSGRIESIHAAMCHAIVDYIRWTIGEDK